MESTLLDSTETIITNNCVWFLFDSSQLKIYEEENRRKENSRQTKKGAE